jgi:hypothetical protein
MTIQQHIEKARELTGDSIVNMRECAEKLPLFVDALEVALRTVKSFRVIAEDEKWPITVEHIDDDLAKITSILEGKEGR